MGLKPEVLRSEDHAAGLLRGRREALGLSQGDLNDAIGLTDGYLAKLESPNRAFGKRAFTQSGLDWAQALGLAVVLMDREQAAALVAASTEPPLTTAPPRAYGGRTQARTPVRRTQVRMRLTFTTPA